MKIPSIEAQCGPTPWKKGIEDRTLKDGYCRVPPLEERTLRTSPWRTGIIRWEEKEGGRLGRSRCRAWDRGSGEVQRRVQPRISCERKAAGEKRGGIVQLERQIRLPVWGKVPYLLSQYSFLNQEICGYITVFLQSSERNLYFCTGNLRS